MKAISFDYPANASGSTLMLLGSFAEKNEKVTELIRGRRIALIADQNVWREYGEAFAPVLAEAKAVTVIEIVSSEENKTLETVSDITRQMLDAGLGRDSLVLAFGGGVVTDIAGFVASIFMRGIPFISVPTTMLAMCDASVGGKCGVNTPLGKNLLGAFYPARMVLYYPEVLKTLPERELKSGLVELVKTGFIADASLIPTENELRRIIQTRDNFALTRSAFEAAKAKLKVVSADFLEKGSRMSLNYGHTLGHALEHALSPKLTHGEAVALGIAFVAENAPSLNLSSPEWGAEQLAILRALDLGTLDWRAAVKKAGAENVKSFLSHDKKTQNDLPTWVVSTGKGAFAVCRDNFLKFL